MYVVCIQCNGRVPHYGWKLQPQGDRQSERRCLEGNTGFKEEQAYKAEM